MKKSKKIGDIYREKLMDFETPPPEDVWQNITAALPEKNRKTRVLPLWYKLAGTAAALILLFALFNTPWQTEPKPYSPVISNPTQKKSYNFNPTSTAFKESMLKSSILLKTLSLEVKSNRPKRDGEEKSILDPTKMNRFSNATANSSPTDNMDNLLSEYSFLSFSEFLKLNPLSLGQKIETKTLAEIPEPELDIAEEEAINETPEKSPLKRFSISTTAGAVYFDNSGSGNALANQYGNKEGSGGISMSYGVNLAYQLSEKVSVRTGVNKVKLGHKSSHNNDNMRYASPTQAIDKEAVILALPASGNLHQNFGFIEGFIEIPMEIEYALINKKFGLNLIGGASTLLLDENTVSFNSPHATTRSGGSRNLNHVSFSTNIGIGLEYNISPSFQFNLEPIFKYQLNTFNNTSGFNPYYFGIYSGLSYKF